MKKFACSVVLRIIVAATLAVSLSNYPQLLLSAAELPSTATDLKTAEQYKTEAARYESAIRAISGITTMRLDTPDDLKKALAIVDSARPNLKLVLSKIVVKSLNDTILLNAVKKRSPTKQAAEDFVKEINADRSVVLKLDGTGALKTRIEQSISADAAILKRAADRLREAGEKVKKASAAIIPGEAPTNDGKFIQTSFRKLEQPSAPETPLRHGQDPVTIGALIIAGMAIAVVFFEVVLFGVVVVLKDKEDSTSECLDKADAKYQSCEDAARNLPFPLNLGQLALCDALLLAEQAACFIP